MHYQITSKCDVRNEPEYDRWSINSEVSEHTKAREETLREQRHNDPEGYANAYKQCPRCEKSFKNKRDTKQHMRYCRREGAKGPPPSRGVKIFYVSWCQLLVG